MNISKKNFSDWYNEVLEKADIIDLRYPVKGMPVYKGWGFAILRNSFALLEALLAESGHQQVLFPLLIPDDQFGKEEEHIKGFSGDVLWATHGGSEELERKLALRPTSETAIYPIFSLWVRSHADLPLKVHQTTCVYRHETKATKPLIRGREVYWNEAHTAHASYEEAEEQTIEALEIYKLFYEALGIPFITVKRPDFDKFPGAVYSVALDALFPDGKTLQIGTIHHMGENFARAYNLVYDDEKGARHFMHTTSYGISMRCLAAIISIHGDDKGLVLPPEVAPLQAIIVPIAPGKDEGVLKKSHELASKIIDAGIRAQVDDGEDRPGEKFYFWEMMGAPLRIEVGARELGAGTVMLVRRDSGEKKTIKEKDILEQIGASLAAVADSIAKKAGAQLKAGMREAKNINELKKIIDAHGGFVKTGWCGRKECADEIKAATTAEIRGTDFPEKQQAQAPHCAVCGGAGKEAVWVAKAY